MSLFDKLRKNATKAVGQHGDKISRGIDAAAKAVDKRTGHKHSATIRKGVVKAKEGMDRLDERRDPGPGGPGSSPPGSDRPPGSTPPESGPEQPPGTGSTPPR